MLISDIAFEGEVYRFKRQSPVIKPRDFLFILDTSGSISGDTYSMAKDNIAKLIGKICGTIGPGPADNRAAVITYSTNPVINFDFKEYLDLADLQAAVGDLPKVSSTTCTGRALNLGQQIFNLKRGLREKGISKKEVVLLTDGKTNCGPNAVEAAFDLKRSRYNPLLFVFAIGQYNDDDKREMEMMASPPTSYHIFHLNNFTEFQQLVNFIYAIPLPCAPIEIRSFSSPPV
ncbi:matrilin-3-like [Liolophura sinensis]|uniref:matrilin-3-like n=1 Tax=Liolophura sinensis TaxID=3198878 RepID=UPI0031590EBB